MTDERTEYLRQYDRWIDEVERLEQKNERLKSILNRIIDSNGWDVADLIEEAREAVDQKCN